VTLWTGKLNIGLFVSLGVKKCILKQLLTQHIMQPTRGANILGMLIAHN